jgi:hypothetical protein
MCSHCLFPVVVTSLEQVVITVLTRLMTVTDLLQIVPTWLIQAVRNKLLRACCYNLVTRLMTVTDFLRLQVVRNKTNTSLLSSTCQQLVTCRRYQTCWNNSLRVCWPHQPCYKMITTCSRLVNNWEQAVRTHLVDKLSDFYACTVDPQFLSPMSSCSLPTHILQAWKGSYIVILFISTF